MIPGRLMTDTIDIVYRTPGTQNRYGRNVLEESSRATVPAWVQEDDRTEEDGDEVKTLVGYTLFLNPTHRVLNVETAIVPPGPEDEIEWRGDTFMVDGGLVEKRRPGRGVHHYEGRIVRVENG